MNSKTIFCFFLVVSSIGVLNAAPAQDDPAQDEIAQDEQDDELVSQDEMQATFDEPLPMLDEADVQADVKVSIRDRRAELFSVMRVVRALGPQYTTCLRAQREPLRKIWKDAKATIRQCRSANKDKETCERAVVVASAEPLGKALLDLAQCIKDTAVKSSGVTRGWFKKIRKTVTRVYKAGQRVCGSGFVNCGAIAGRFLG